MKRTFFIKFLLVMGAIFLSNYGVFAQSDKMSQIKSQEISETDGVPVLIKHLPDWENVRKSAVLAHTVNDLRQTLGDRPVLDLIDFAGGTEAVTANYPQGKLLIVEYTNPQESIETDTKTKEKLAADNQNIFYRRTGNYNIFVFEAADEAAANSLLDQIKYEKTVQWLGEDPTLLHRAERAYIQSTSNLIMGIVFSILAGMGIAISIGLLAGGIYVYVMSRKRASMQAFSDAGGMVRLNLDKLSAEPMPRRFLK